MDEINEPRFQPDVLFAHYKQVRNRVRKFDTESLVLCAVDALHKAWHGGVQTLRYYQPWNILVLIKWVLEESHHLVHPATVASTGHLHELLNNLHVMEEYRRMPTEYEHVYLFVRHLAFQQFWLQANVKTSALARQELLFSGLDRNHSFQTDFHRVTGVRCSDFVEFSFYLVCLMLTHPKIKSFRLDHFGEVDQVIRSKVVEPCFRLLSQDFAQLGLKFKTLTKTGHEVADELLLPSPLVEVPLLKREEEFVIYSPPLLFRALENGIYRVLKSATGQNFCERFGALFERYVASSLNDAGITFQTEEQLQRNLPGTGKCVDFLIEEQGCRILIDAKGVEISNLGLISHRAQVIFRSIKNSAGKAVVQGMETSVRISRALSDREPTTEFFLIVISWDALNLGPGAELERLFGEPLVKNLHRDYGTPLPIPLENIFFVTIDEFDELLARVYFQKTTILTALRFAKKGDLDPKTRKFSLGQHLQEICAQSACLPRLESAIDQITRRCSESLKKARDGKPGGS